MSRIDIKSKYGGNVKMSGNEAREKRLEKYQKNIDFLDEKYWYYRSAATDLGPLSGLLGIMAFVSLICASSYSPNWGWEQYFHNPQMSLLAIGALLSLLCLVLLGRCVGHEAEANKYFNELKFYEAHDFAIHLQEMHSRELQAAVEKLAK